MDNDSSVTDRPRCRYCRLPFTGRAACTTTGRLCEAIAPEPTHPEPEVATIPPSPLPPKEDSPMPRPKGSPNLAKLIWTCGECAFEQSIKTRNTEFALALTENEERKCLDTTCEGSMKLMVVSGLPKPIKCDQCGEVCKPDRKVAGGNALPKKKYCSNTCRGRALDALLQWA